MRLIAPARRSSPSFSGTGDGQVRSDLHHDVARQFVSPISGMIATAFPTRGSTKYQGRGAGPGELADEPREIFEIGLRGDHNSIELLLGHQSARPLDPALELAGGE